MARVSEGYESAVARAYTHAYLDVILGACQAARLPECAQRYLEIDVRYAAGNAVGGYPVRRE